MHGRLRESSEIHCLGQVSNIRWDVSDYRGEGALRGPVIVLAVSAVSGDWRGSVRI